MKASTRAPDHLSPESKRIWREVVQEYSLDDAAGLRILRVALESFDRAQAARKAIDRDGMTTRDKAGQLKSHPLLPIERDSRAAFLAGLKALNLDIEPPNHTIGRPPGR